MGTLQKLKSKLRAWLRIWVGLKYIRCERPDDVLVIARFGNQREWEYTMEQVAQILGGCGHPHSIIFGDAKFQNGPTNKNNPR